MDDHTTTDHRTIEQLRSIETRHRLLDATLEAVAEDGWAGASTSRICERAGVSRGAQTHHYPTKAALVTAAFQRAALAHGDTISTCETDRGDEPTLPEFLEQLWEVFLDDRYIQSGLEMMVVGRTDARLRRMVTAFDDAAIDTTLEAGRKNRTDPLLADELVELSIYLLRGMALRRGLNDDEEHRRGLFERWLAVIDSVAGEEHAHGR